MPFLMIEQTVPQLSGVSVRMPGATILLRNRRHEWVVFAHTHDVNEAVAKMASTRKCRKYGDLQTSRSKGMDSDADGKGAKGQDLAYLTTCRKRYQGTQCLQPT